MKKIIALAVVAAACSTTAMAQSTTGLYGEAAYVMVSAKDTAEDLGTFKPTLGRFTLGTVVTDNVAVEGFLTQGLSTNSRVVAGENIEYKAKTGYGVALRPFVNLSEEIELFGRVGYIRNDAELNVSSNGSSEKFGSKTTNSLYGIGVAYKIDKNLSAVADYTKLSNKDGFTNSMVAIGVRFNF